MAGKVVTLRAEVTEFASLMHVVVSEGQIRLPAGPLKEQNLWLRALRAEIDLGKAVQARADRDTVKRLGACVGVWAMLWSRAYRNRGPGQDALGTADVAAMVPDFANAMEQRLRANDHKAGWKRDSVESLVDQMRASQKKLALSMHGKESVAVVGRRAANLANFAMMVADRYGLRLDEESDAAKSA